MPRPANRRTSEILQQIIDSSDGDISVGGFLELLGDRAFALAILIFSLPNSLPIPGIPGFSTITGLPITFIALQMVMGRNTIWLPKSIAAKRFSRVKLAQMLQKTMPSVLWLERFLMPRMHWVCSPFGERVIGGLFVILSLVIALPIPGGNFLPGLSMSLIALGLLEQDGLFVLCACGFALMSLNLMYKFIMLFLKTVWHWIAGLF